MGVLGGGGDTFDPLARAAQVGADGSLDLRFAVLAPQ